jgi:hypothetical protein
MIRKIVLGVTTAAVSCAGLAAAGPGVASAAQFTNCQHPAARVTVRPPLGALTPRGQPRRATLRITTVATAEDLTDTCGVVTRTTRDGEVLTSSEGRVRLSLKRASNECAGISAQSVWQGKATVAYVDPFGRIVAKSKRTGTFRVLDLGLSEMGGAIQINSMNAPGTGVFAGTNLELKFSYDQFYPSAAQECAASRGWSGLPSPSSVRWQEF